MKTFLVVTALLSSMLLVDIVAPAISPILGPTVILGLVGFLVYWMIKSVK
jgi:hypothetical protein